MPTEHKAGSFESKQLRLCFSIILYIGTTVVPAMNGQPREQAKVSVHDRWPLVGGMSGLAVRQT